MMSDGDDDINQQESDGDDDINQEESDGDDDINNDLNFHRLKSSFSIRALWSCFSESLNNLTMGSMMMGMVFGTMMMGSMMMGMVLGMMMTGMMMMGQNRNDGDE